MKCVWLPESIGTSLDPLWSDLELHLCGDEFLRVRLPRGDEEGVWSASGGSSLQEGDGEVPQDEAEHEKSVPTPSNDPQPSAKDTQAHEIASLKKRIQRLERKKLSRPIGLKRLKKVGMSRRVESSEDQESLGALKDASKQGRSIEDMDAELIKEQKLARKQEEEANIALIESRENIQAMMEADRLLAERLQSKEREELTDEEKAKLYMELMKITLVQKM
ncbi:hypothetical protein Tco_1154458 [Tanacetum coccineum]